jgi:hypothetical protein
MFHGLNNDEEAGEVVEVTDEDGNVRMVTAADFAYTSPTHP